MSYWHRHKGPALKPGWKMTPAQCSAYWRQWAEVCRVQAWTGLPTAKLDELRADLHERAGLGRCSAKEIDKGKMFDAYLSACLAITKPCDLDTQLRLTNMQTTREITGIERLAPEAVRLKIMRDKFGGRTELTALSPEERRQLRDTLARWNGRAEPAAAEEVPAAVESENPF